MNWEIYVLGDAAYVFAVLNAISGFNSYGLFGALGAVLGLLILTLRGITAQGTPRLDPHWILLSIVIYWVMFVPRIDRVIVTEMGTQPGNATPQTMVVDNVPFGIAAVGTFVSRLGRAVSLTYDTAFGSAEDEARVLTGGIGQNLALLAQLRMLNDPHFNDPEGNLESFRRSLARYMHDCTLRGFQGSHKTLNAVFRHDWSADNTEGGIWYNHQAITTVISSPDGEGFSESVVSCAEARPILMSMKDSGGAGGLTGAFDRASEQRGIRSRSRDIQGSFASFGSQVTTRMQDIMAAQMINAVAVQASLNGPLTHAETATTIMVEEAATRKNAQFVAEESLFIRMLRPLVSFFEALFYALAPIMAFLVSTGQFGWGLTIKYLMLTVWVVLWFPMLSIIQLYGNTQMAHFFEQIQDNVANPLTLQVLVSHAMDQLGTTSALVAATPALAMSLIYGGAVTMSALAGRLQSTDVVNENLAAPQAADIRPVLVQNQAASASVGGGTTLQDGSQPNIAIGDAFSTSASLSRQAVERNQVALGNGVSQLLESGTGISNIDSTGNESSSSRQFSQDFGNVITDAERRGVITAEQAQVARSLDETGRLSAFAQVTATAGTPGSGILGSGVSAQAGGRVEGSTTSQDTQSESQSVQQELAQALSRDQTARDGLSNAVATRLTDSSAAQSTVGFRTADGQTLSEVSSDVLSSSRTATTLETAATSVGTNEQIPLSTAAQRTSDATLQNAYAAIQADPQARELFDARLAHYQNSDIRDDRSQVFAATYDTLRSSAQFSGSGTGALETAYTNLLTDSTDHGGMLTAPQTIRDTRDFDATFAAAPSGPVSGVEAGSLQGPGITRSQVIGRAEEIQSQVEREQLGSADHIDSQRGNYASSSDLAPREQQISNAGATATERLRDESGVSKANQAIDQFLN